MKFLFYYLFFFSIASFSLKAEEGVNCEGGEEKGSASEEILKTREELLFDAEKLALLNPDCQPAHIAIIPDGNRRWANLKGVMLHVGYKKGAEALLKTVLAAQSIGIEVMTFYCFSTENWRRNEDEVCEIMQLFEDFLQEYGDQFVEQSIKLEVIGDLSRLSPSLFETIERVRAATKLCSKIKVVLAMNYGGRDEIVRAVQNLVQDLARGVLSADEINEERMSDYLDTTHWRDPDLLIRTSGEKRLSNFLLWQLSYAELAFPQVLWPDFTANDLLDILIDFQQRQRRFGGSDTSPP